MAARGKMFWFLGLMPLLFGFDYGTKQAVSSSIPLGSEVQVIPGWLSLYHVENPYIVISIPLPYAAIVVGVSLAVVAMLWTLWKLPSDARLPSAAIAAVMAGALGNLVDRLGDGKVTDFVRMYAGHEPLRGWLVGLFDTATWPIYNVADVCVLAGAAMWMLASATEKERVPEEVT
jgi:signal peptidase II